MSDTTIEGRCRSYAAIVATAAVTLGLLAFAADSLDGVVGRVVVGLTSSGFAWGLAAFLAGRTATTAKQAAVGATALLVVATLLYYLLILLVSRRWSGATLEDGTSADLHGLRSVAVMTAVWLVGSLVAGPMLGLLGYVVRVAGTPAAAWAAGVTCGLLSGDGWQSLVQIRPWMLPLADLRYQEFILGVVISELVKITLSLAVLVWLVREYRLRRAWPILLITTIASGLLSALLWYGVNAVRNGV